MSKSYRTNKTSVTANRNFNRDNNGEITLPRIIERKPHPGDVHPIPKKLLSKMINAIPTKYLYGLSRIELRARESLDIGKPFGIYLGDEKLIIIYSVPIKWKLDELPESFRESLDKFYAKVEHKKDHYLISWPEKHLLAMWCYFEIFAHELAHHYRNQFKHKRKMGGEIDEEIVADLYARRFMNQIFSDYDRKKKAED